MFTGTIKTWNPSRGYGFIGREPGEPDLFMHIRDFDGSATLLCEGQHVRFDVGIDTRSGKPKAENVRVI
jgi:CspA family cold shock protein